MELRRILCLLLALSCSSVQPKRLVIPEEMRRPLSTGQTVREASAPKVPEGGSVEVYRVRGGAAGGTEGTPVTDDLSGPKTAAPAVGPSPKPAAVLTPPAPAPAPQRTSQRLPPPTTDPAQRYTLRLVEHGRVWEVELPESTGGYELHIPLGPSIEPPTAADQEMLGNTPPPGRSKSYLATLAKVGEMYADHRYELALIEVVDLEQQYPKDPRLQAMKGSLYQKLGKGALARQAWKRALELDPSDTTVAEALRALKEE